jgi:hypothetical protein
MKALANSDAISNPQVEFIKIDDGHILVRTTRGNVVTEAVISTVPPSESRSSRSTTSPTHLRQSLVTGH